MPRKWDYRTDTQMDRRTDRHRTKWSLIAAMLRRRPNKWSMDSFYTGGYYIYTEVSGKRANQTARIISSLVRPSLSNRVSCLTFYYHMKGSTMGSLNLYLTSSPYSRRLGYPSWKRKGQQGSTWRKAQVTVSRSTPYYVSCALYGYRIFHDKTFRNSIPNKFSNYWSNRLHVDELALYIYHPVVRGIWRFVSLRKSYHPRTLPERDMTFLVEQIFISPAELGGKLYILLNYSALFYNLPPKTVQIRIPLHCKSLWNENSCVITYIIRVMLCKQICDVPFVPLLLN